MARGAKSKSRYKNHLAESKMMKQQTSPGNSYSNNASTSRNRFSPLSDLIDMDAAPSSNLSVVKQQKPPPIVVEADTPFIEIQNLLGKECIYKRTSIGTKVFPPNIELYNCCLQILKESKKEFHSFNPKENRLYTTFLYGLPKVDPVEIKAELTSYNLIPTHVSEVNTKFSSNNNAFYKVQFTRKTFNPDSLKNVKTISNVLISWKKYKQRNNDKPTQCWNCLMYGHGGEHCHRSAACMICAGEHHTKDCPYNTNEKRPAVFSCFNCKKHGRERFDHSANDVNCPFRSLYLEARARAT